MTSIDNDMTPHDHLKILKSKERSISQRSYNRTIDKTENEHKNNIFIENKRITPRNLTSSFSSPKNSSSKE